MMSIIASAESGPSMTASATTLPDTIAPSAPQQLTATPGQRKVTLAWIASTDQGGSGLSGYEIWRSTTGSQGAFTRITTTSALSVVNSGLSKNTTYWYYVTAVDGAQNRSAASGIVSAQPQ
jgi:fibronectin type 3 domain-containing protein